MTAQELLRTYWKHEQFRPPQDEIIASVLEEKDTLALLPTGGGKSVCYQIPALMRPGICIVVSPLIALMKDQVKSLSDKGIKAIALTGSLQQNELSDLLDNALFGDYKFLYLSPERLQTGWIAERIKGLRVNLIAVDEAHCISQWGHDFRPAYRNISNLRDFFPAVPLIALTASATAQVASDIKTQLKISEGKTFQLSFARPNIALGLVYAEDKLFRCLDLLQKVAGPSIVYVRNRKACLEWSAIFNSKGVSATFYHGGLSTREKEGNMQSWMEGSRRVMVATNAFGMGIDRADVRSVIHIQLPENLENYYQEAGRAGRDGEKSYAILISSPSDAAHARRQFVETLPDREFLLQVYRKICTYFQIAYGEGYDESFSFNLNQFCLKYDLPVTRVFRALQFLDRQAVLSFSREFHASVSLRLTLPSRELIRYNSLNPKDEPVLLQIVRDYPGIYELDTKINLPVLSRRSGVPESKIVSILEKMQEKGLAEFRSGSQDATLLFHEVREDERTINRVAGFLKEENTRKARQLDSVIAYVSHDDRCKSRELLEYFGEETTDCGICSYCVSRKRAVVSRKDLRNLVREALNGVHLDSRALEQKMQVPAAELLAVLGQMLEEGEIAITDTNTYKIIR